MNEKGTFEQNLGSPLSLSQLWFGTILQAISKAILNAYFNPFMQHSLHKKSSVSIRERGIFH